MSVEVTTAILIDVIVIGILAIFTNNNIKKNLNVGVGF